MSLRQPVRQKPIPLAIQMEHISKNFKEFSCSIDRNTGIWRGRIQPTPANRSYLVEIKYHLHESPEVFIIEPQLTRRKDQHEIPHTYSDERLCLFLPRSREWHGGLLLTQTIIPWTVLWLFYYEAWLATGDWLGGGVHPRRSER